MVAGVPYSCLRLEGGSQRTIAAARTVDMVCIPVLDTPERVPLRAEEMEMVVVRVLSEATATRTTEAQRSRRQRGQHQEVARGWVFASNVARIRISSADQNSCVGSK